MRLAVFGAIFVLVWTGFLLVRAPVTAYQSPIAYGAPIVPILGNNKQGFLWFTTFFVTAWATFALALLALTKRKTRNDRPIVATVSVAVILVSILVFPGTSVDIWHNIADGRILWRLSLNPLLTVPDFVQAADPIIRRTTEA